MKKICISIIILVLILSMTACGKSKKEEEISLESSSISVNVMNENNELELIENNEIEPTDESIYIPIDEGRYNLEKDLEEGLITTDEYVLYTLYDSYGDKRLDSKYESTLNASINTTYLVEKYMDELSKETLQYFWDKLCLKGIASFGKDDDFDIKDASNTKKSIKNPFLLEVQASEFQINQQILDNIVVSRNGNFVVWYSDNAEHGITKADAEDVAENLEKAITEYETLTGLDYVFDSTMIKTGIKDVHGQQVETLKKNNYSTDYLKKAMQIYVVDIPNGDAATYYTLSPDTKSKIITYLNGYDGNSPVMPYILINRSTVKDAELCKQICYHEFFHHIQNVFCDGEQQYYDVMMNEATANWFSAKVSQTIDGNTYLNVFASKMLSYSSSLFTELYYVKDNLFVGYTIFPFLQYYEKNVDDGMKKILDSIKKEDGLAYLESQATLNESVALMKDMAVNNLIQDPANGITLSAPSENAFVPITSEIVSEKKDGTISINNKGISKLHIDYYRISFNKDWFNNEDFSVNYSFKEDNTNSGRLWMYIIGAKDIQGKTEYRLCSSLPIHNNGSTLRLTNDFCKDYDAIYFAVTNASMTTTFNYTLNVNIENTTNDIVTESHPEDNFYEDMNIIMEDKIDLPEEAFFELDYVPEEKMISESEIVDLIRGIKNVEELEFGLRIFEIRRMTQIDRYGGYLPTIQTGLDIIWHEPVLENVYSPIKGTKYSYDVDELNRIFNAITTDRIFEDNIPESATLDGNRITFKPCNEEPETRIVVKIVRMYYNEENRICIDFNFRLLYNSENTYIREGTTLACFDFDEDTGKYKLGYHMEYNSRIINTNE